MDARGSITRAAAPPAVVVERASWWAPSRWVGWALLGCCVALLLTGVVAGERNASYDELRAAVARGDVDEVTVAGALDEASRGRAVVEVHWRSGLVGHVAHAVEVHPTPDRVTTRDGVPIVRSVEEDLAALDPGIVVGPRSYDGYTELLGWRLPQWTGVVALVVLLGTFVLIVAGPAPWRATRWAWFWLLALAWPVGVLGFLLLGGPTGPLRPANRRPGLRGGWGFLLAMLLGSAIGTAGG